MPGLDPKLVEHRLKLKPDSRPIKQKLRKLDPRVEQQVKEGLEDLLKGGFIRAIDYPDWLANIVAVPKRTEKFRFALISGISIRLPRRMIIHFPTLIF